MHALTITQQFPVAIETLFKAWTDPRTMQRWFAPGAMTVPTASADLRVGGRYEIVMEDADKRVTVGGEYLQILPHTQLSFSWKWAHGEHTTRVDLRFTALGDKQTELELKHSEFIDQESCDHHGQGWQGCLANLNKLCA